MLPSLDMFSTLEILRPLRERSSTFCASTTDNSADPIKSTDVKPTVDNDDASSADDSAVSIRQARKAPRPKTYYSLRYPPPASGKKPRKNVRKGTLLQLHMFTPSTKPTPTFDLVPLASIPTWVSKKVSKSFLAANDLSINDLALMRAEDYVQSENDAERSKARDIPGIISIPRKVDGSYNSGKILFDDGAQWTPSPLSNGGYEFVSTAEDGSVSKVRWVVKRPQGGRSTSSPNEVPPRPSTSVGDAGSGSQAFNWESTLETAKQFNFSIISQNSRRHPIIAHLSSSMIDIQDFYNVPTPNTQLSSSSAEDYAPRPSTRSSQVETTPALRMLITATATWIALREGWTPGFQMPKPLSVSTLSAAVASSSTLSVPRPTTSSKSSLKLENWLNAKSEALMDLAPLSLCASAPSAPPQPATLKPALRSKSDYPRSSSSSTSPMTIDNKMSTTEVEEGITLEVVDPDASGKRGRSVSKLWRKALRM